MFEWTEKITAEEYTLLAEKGDEKQTVEGTFVILN